MSTMYAISNTRKITTVCDRLIQSIAFALRNLPSPGARLVHANTHDGNNLHRALDESVTEQDLENYVSKVGAASPNPSPSPNL